ncbi:carbohydrate ABC transporter permease [Paenibacillus senegalimassiliensis]|uniref:carbohydrate ABC transporter permease n=1 Tax=Paenibacillus senegalimassiliensis TaxID=1737426 RepID=UPI00073EC804|nr:carbohydrate ABC transporter permease [Paenibacillus senegalimassiliensis]
MLKKRNAKDWLLDGFIYLFMIALAVMTLTPFLNLLAKSVSEEWAVVSGKVTILPIGFQLETLKFVVTSSNFTSSLGISALVTVIGTVMAILLTAVTAYPLSKPQIPGVSFILILFVFTMLFSGGIIPNYLLIRELNLLNHLGSLILPGMISVFNLLVMKSYFEGLPEALEESAKIDGARTFTILFRIILPISSPVIATISLFYAVGYWNDFFSAMLYISDPALKTLQIYLKDIVINADLAALGMSPDDMMNLPGEGVRAAAVIASTVPILCVYPFLQKYFVKGVLIGSVKG